MNCPSCKSDSPFKIIARCKTHEISKCGQCGLLRNESYFSRADFKNDLFEEEYYEAVQSEAFKTKLDDYQKDPSRKIYTEYLQIIEKQIQPGNALDVGCAFGNFLKLAHERGWKPFGVELSAYAARMARENWGFDIYMGDLTHAPFQDQFFDLVTFWDVIEHVADARANLKKAHTILKPGGYLLLTTDNAKSLIGDLGFLFYNLSLGRWTYPLERFLIPHNTYYFNPRQMKVLLKDIGFEIISSSGIDYPLHKINLSKAEKPIVWILYRLGELLRAHSQFLMIAKKI